MTKYMDSYIIAWTMIGSHIAPVHFFIAIRTKWNRVDQRISGTISFMVSKDIPNWAKGRALWYRP